MEALNGLEGFSFCTPLQPSSCHPGIISLLGLWIANTGYRKTNHRGWALHLVTPGSWVCDRCNKSPRHFPWHATWSSWHHDWSQRLKIYTQHLSVATVTQSQTNWVSEPPVKFVVWSWDSCQGEMCPGMIWNCILAAPAWLTEPAPTKNKIMKAERFVCFPKTLLASRITVFLPQPKYLRESELRPSLTGPQQINSEWNSWLINSRFIRACSLGGGKGSLLVVASHSFTSLPP